MTVVCITLPKGEKGLMTDLLVNEGRAETRLASSWKVKGGMTYRLWDIEKSEVSMTPQEDFEAWLTAMIPSGLDYVLTDAQSLEDPIVDEF